MIRGRNKKDRTNQDIEVEWTRHWSIILSKRRAFNLLELETQDARLAKRILDKKKCSKILEQRHGSLLGQGQIVWSSSQLKTKRRLHKSNKSRLKSSRNKRPKLRTQQDNKGLLLFFWKCSYFVKWKEMVLLWLGKAWNCNLSLRRAIGQAKRSLLSKSKRKEALIRRSWHANLEWKTQGDNLNTKKKGRLKSSLLIKAMRPSENDLLKNEI